MFSKFLKNGGTGISIACGVTAFISGFLFNLFHLKENIFNLIFFIALPILVVGFIYSIYVNKNKQ
jgi:hypothetical protein